MQESAEAPLILVRKREEVIAAARSTNAHAARFDSASVLSCTISNQRRLRATRKPTWMS